MLFVIILFWPITLPLIAAYSYAIYWLFKKQTYLPVVAMLLFPFVANEAFQYYWFAKVIPEKIGITYPVSIKDEGGFREGCGTAVFKVSDSTLEAIKKDGLKFFSGATQGRGHLSEPYYQYAEWQETPVPPSWTSEGSWILCTGLSHSEHSKIVSAAKESGAYFTMKHEGQLVLIPSLGYVVFSFFG
jgi:hypothetical protein